jgi:hypothetical protein
MKKEKGKESTFDVFGKNARKCVLEVLVISR